MNRNVDIYIQNNSLIFQAKTLESYSIYDFVFKGFKSNPERVVDTIMRTEINIYLSQCVATSNIAYAMRCRCCMQLNYET